MNRSTLKQLGLSDKQIKVYLGLLQLGPSSVRELSEYVNINRGTVYDSLDWLREKELVEFYNKDKKKHFVANNPDKIKSIVSRKKQELTRLSSQVDELIPELRALVNQGANPVAKYFHNEEISEILQDVLNTCEKQNQKDYRIYSAEGLREYLYQDFSSFSKERIDRGIKVKAIAIGEGGELRGLDERRWLQKKMKTPTYIIVYSGKTAYISLNNKEEPVGVVINNEGVYQTQRFIFDQLWCRIGSTSS